MAWFQLRLMERLGLAKPKSRHELDKERQRPYRYLTKVPRYQDMSIELLGKVFKISDSMSFYSSYKEIFIDEIYKFDAETAAPIIIDCGANYGVSVIYFKTLYPDAKIVAIEADPDIFELLKWNIEQQGLKDVTLINKAVAVSNEPITFYKEGSDGGRTAPINSETKSVTVETVDLDSLIKDRVDFLKVDIEGAENEVIPASKKLHLVEQLFIEYHSLVESPQTLSAILDAISKNGFRYYIRTQFCSPRPLTEEGLVLGMDLQLNIFGKRK